MPGILKRSVAIGNYRTSVSLEDEFWDELGRIADHEGVSRNALIAEIAKKRKGGNLSSALRLYVLEQVQS
jgi:predicted DNA-binding ribbon-helix-helix protein